MIQNFSNPTQLPLVSILATGGTVAGSTTAPDKPAEYKPAALSPDALLESVAGLERVCRLRVRTVAAVGSEDMTPEIWLSLARAVATETADPAVAGVVVLHGTDTMEETAMFLHLVQATATPVVLTGAMRPADALSADGSANIMAAVRTAQAADAAGRGVLAVMNDRIHRGIDLVKADTLDVAAFSSAFGGPAGRLVNGAVRFHLPPGQAVQPAFHLDAIDVLPRVDILYGHAGQGPELAEASLAGGAWGIVHAGVGLGNVHRDVGPVLRQAVGQGVPVVAASRVPFGPCPLTESHRRDGFIAAWNLSPHKARVLLQLALLETTDRKRIQAYFDTFR